MINSTYLYLLFSSIVVSFIIFIIFYYKNNKSNISNKVLLKNLLESLDLEIPDELKRLDNTSADPQKKFL